MAYVSSAASVRMVLPSGIAIQKSSGAGISGGGALFTYISSHASSDITGVTGFFLACGAGPYSSTGTLHPNVVPRSPNNVGMRPGDVVMNIESSAGATPGRVTLNGVNASTFNGSTASYSSAAG